ncbi:Astacin-like metalloendopeptidase [Aphelenchoides besseyi]|nr:Astacin-like metalloendopeptidase [Aphelenchoides besseyi]KAI6229293.1 Astacin-like metalloendopeptidase [Aphelenchoides besseyi]
MHPSDASIVIRCSFRLIILLVLVFVQSATADKAYSDVFLLPQDFDLAETENVHKPTPEELDAIQNNDLFEGDIMGITPMEEEFNSRRMRDDVDEDRIFGRPYYSSLNVDTYADKLWGNGRIPYLLEEGMSSSQRSAIAQAFLEYKDKTCINFSPKEPDDYDYIYIKRNIASGCSSYVGRAGGNQTVSLEVVKCFSKGIIAHELMHAIGFFHEHSRTDRDDYVLIDEKNVRPGMLRNFEKYPRKVIDPLGMPYDYESIMHYHKLAFSRNGRPTIMPRNDTAEIGQRYKLSEVDALKINKLYKCDKFVESSNREKSITRRPNQFTTTTDASFTTIRSRMTTSEETSGELNRRTSSLRGSSKMVTASPQPPTMLFTRVTSDRWKYLTDRYVSTTTVRPRTSRLPESSMEKTRKELVVVNKVVERECKNLNAHCDMWERLGHCEHSVKYMRHYCRRSCGLCPRDGGSGDERVKRPSSPSSSGSSTLSRGACVDKNLFCGYWSRIGECRSESKFMKVFCKRSCGYC